MKNVTLVAIEFQWYDLTRYAIEHSLKHIDPKEIVIISDREILPGARHVIRPPVANIAEYAGIMLNGVGEHVNTDHALYVQWDGIAHDQAQWTDDFLNYDYVGAVWPWEPATRNVGNGGFSLRSKRLLDICATDHQIRLTEQDSVAEDKIIGNIKRDYLEQTHNIKFAPETLAKQFSFELGNYVPSFGFHGLWNVFHFMSDADMDYYVERIDYRGWNHYKWHHVLAAVIRRERMDLYEILLSKIIEHSPELLGSVAAWLEQDSQNPTVDISIM
jgi:hypothetical protein